MVMSDVKEEEVVNRITKLSAELHFSGDRSSISGMKGNKLVMENMDYNKEKLTTKFAKMGRKLFQSRMSSMHLLFVILITQVKT